MKRLLIFSGTADGRRLIEEALALGFAVTASVATDYGREFLSPREELTVRTGRLDVSQMAELMSGCRAVIDATHPYATGVSQNIRAACETRDLPYIRFLRPQIPAEGCDYFPSLEAACRAANDVPGNILAATGSKEIARYAAIGDFESRVFARVLDTPESLELCRAAGLPEDHILAGTGPFSYQQNLQTLRDFDVCLLVTKDGGAVGGFPEKLAAAKDHGARVFVIERPRETGRSFEEVLSILREEL